MVYSVAPPRKPTAAAVKPPVSAASSIRSSDSAEISTPLPKAITAATTRCGTWVSDETSAPSSSAEPATSPQNAAVNAEAGMRTMAAVDVGRG